MPTPGSGPITDYLVVTQTNQTILVNAAKATGTFTVSMAGIIPPNTERIHIFGYISVAAGTSSNITGNDLNGTVCFLGFWGTQVSAGYACFSGFILMGKTLSFSYTIATGNTSLTYIQMSAIWVPITRQLYPAY